MKLVPEETLAAVVSEAAKQLSTPQYTETVVGAFVHAQPQLLQYISAKQQKLGGVEGTIHTVFHAAMILKSIERTLGRTLSRVGFDDLNRASVDNLEEALGQVQPSLGSYIASNVESAD